MPLVKAYGILTVVVCHLLVGNWVLRMITVTILSGIYDLLLIFQSQCQIHGMFKCFVFQATCWIVWWWCLILLCHNRWSYRIHFIVFDLSALFGLIAFATTEHQHQTNEQSEYNYRYNDGNQCWCCYCWCLSYEILTDWKWREKKRFWFTRASTWRILNISKKNRKIFSQWKTNQGERGQKELFEYEEKCERVILN